jgi:carbon-monoxide dehydrogenase medium subunit
MLWRNTAAMKLADIAYARPGTIDEAIALLAAGCGTARAIAGGQSLMPLLAFRMSAPKLLVDIGRLPGLDGIDVGVAGVSIGALVRWRDIEKSTELARAHPLLVQALGHVAHYQIRNRGTVGGSLAHADPAAELPGIAVTCDAQIRVAGRDGERVVSAAQFFLGALTTCLAEDELIVSLVLPPWPAGRRWGFEEFSRRRGDFAMAGVAVFFDCDAEGRCVDPHVGAIGVGAVPRRLAPVEQCLAGRVLDGDTIARAAEAASICVDPPDDIHAPAAYRRALLATLTERALIRAAA